MRTVTGNIWQFINDGPICIPTNGYLTRNGVGVMGRGLALQAKERYPDVAYNLGKHLQREGNAVGWILLHPVRLIAVPVKPSMQKISSKEDLRNMVSRVAVRYSIGDEVPGYHCKADPNLIRRSLLELVAFINKHQIDNVYLPRLGCGNGELNFNTDILPILHDLQLPNSITLVSSEENYND